MFPKFKYRIKWIFGKIIKWKWNVTQSYEAIIGYIEPFAKATEKPHIFYLNESVSLENSYIQISIF